MKNSLLAIVLLCTFQLNAQIPDSLNIELPWQIVKLADCEGTMGEGPQTDNENVFIDLESDIIQLDNQGECTLRTRKWVMVDWLSGEMYDYIQVGSLFFGDPITCEQDMTVTYDELPLSLSIEDVVLNYDSNQEYAFSFNDLNDNEREFDAGDKGNYDLYVYNYTTQEICKVNLYLTACEDDIVLGFPESAEIIFNQEPYLEVTPEMLGINIVYPCAGFSIDINVGNSTSNLLYSNAVGTAVNARVKVSFNDGNEYIKNIEMRVGGEKPDPIPMYIEEVEFNAGETIEIDIWSESIEGMIAWQFELQFQDAEVLDLIPGNIFEDIPFNIFEDDKYIRSLWTPLNASSINVEPDITWFTLQIRPSIDGNTFDIFEAEQTQWSLIGIEDEDYIFEYEAEFVFNIAPRDILNDVNDNGFASLEIYPNPAQDRIYITGLTRSNEPTKIELIDIEGRTLSIQNYSSTSAELLIDVSELTKGMYILKIQNGEWASSHKISKM